MSILPTKKQSEPAQNSIWQTNISDILFPGRKKKIPTTELALFCRKMSYLLGSGLSLRVALPILQGQSLGPGLGAVLPQIHMRIMKGDSFCDALKAIADFPEFMLGYIAIGEKTAQLAKVCEKLADYYEEQTQAKKEMLSALLYPATVFLMMIAVILISMLTVLPGYAQIFETSNVTLPFITQILMSASTFMANNILLLSVVLVAIIAIVASLVSSKYGRTIISFFQLKIPLTRQAINLNLSQALSILLTSGINLSEAVLLCANIIDNIYVKQDLQKLSANLAEGMEFADTLKAISYIDPLLHDLAHVGERTGDLPQAMEKCHSYFVIDYKYNLNRMNKLIEPIITLTMGILLAIVMLAVVLPTFELATAV